jgi:hypothetical protein
LRRLTDLAEHLQAVEESESPDKQPHWKTWHLISPTTNFYDDAFKRGAWEAAAREVQSLWVAGKRPEAIAKVQPEMVIQANLPGDTEMVRNCIRAYTAAGRRDDATRRSRRA